MTSLYFSELNKLKNTQKQLERYQTTIIDQLSKIQNPESQQVIQYFQTSRLACDDTDRKLEIQEILDKLKYVQRAVFLESGNNIPDLELFEEDLISVINRIQELKVQSKVKVEELTVNENQLNEDVKLYSERLCSWTEQLKLDSYSNEVASKVDTSNSDLPNDVRKFMDFVKTSHGHENRWSPNDHHLFLKLRKKFPDVTELSLNIHEILPDISVEDVKRHEAWYVKYLELKVKHNDAIKRWKKLRRDVDASATDFVHQITASEIEKNPVKLAETVQQKTREKKRTQEEIENWKNRQNDILNVAVLEIGCFLQKKQFQKERESMRKMQQTLKANEIKELKMKERERKEKNKMKKEMVKKWKEEKIASEEERKKCEEAKNNIEHNVRTSVANKMIKYYQIRDKVIYDKYIKTPEKLDGMERKTKSNYEMSRDPQRLFRPTQQWINRFLANNEDNPNRPVNFIGRIPKLQRPSWRQNL